jgi:hypothetical protein
VKSLSCVTSGTILREKANKPARKRIYFTLWLVPCTNVLLEMLIVAQQIKVLFPCFSVKIEVWLWCAQELCAVLCPQPDEFSSHTYFSFKIHINIVPSYTPKTPLTDFRTRISYIRISFLHACCMTRTSPPPQFAQPSNVCWSVHIISPLTSLFLFRTLFLCTVNRVPLLQSIHTYQDLKL